MPSQSFPVTDEERDRLRVEAAIARRRMLGPSTTSPRNTETVRNHFFGSNFAVLSWKGGKMFSLGRWTLWVGRHETRLRDRPSLAGAVKDR